MFWRKQEAVSVFILGNQANSWILSISNSGNLSSIFSIPLLYRSLQFLFPIPLCRGFSRITILRQSPTGSSKLGNSLYTKIDRQHVGPEMRWFAIDIAIFGFRLAMAIAWTVGKRCQSFWHAPETRPESRSKLRTDSQIDNFLIWFDGDTVNVIGGLAVLSMD